MNARRRNEGSAVTRREALGTMAMAAAAVAVPGQAWARSAEGLPEEASRCLWFAQECQGDVFRAYTIEQCDDGTLWVEYDDGYLHAFAPGEWSLERMKDGHCLWVRESEDAWSGYECVTESEAESLLEEVV